MSKAPIWFLLLACSARIGKGAELVPFTISGFVDAYSAISRNDPADRHNFQAGVGTTGSRSTPLNLNLFAVDIQRKPARWGFHLIAGAGTAMDIVHSGESASLRREIRRYVYQASVATRVSQKVELEAGIYPSHIGFESFLSKDNWTYTRGWLAEFSPYYQTGVKATFHIRPHLSAQVHVVRGWQLIGDNNHARSFGTQLAWTGERLSVAVNTLAGPELPNDTHHRRTLVDLVVSGQLTPGTSIAGSLDAGQQQDPAGGRSHWWAAGVQGRRAMTSRLALAARIERFVDPRGVVAGDLKAVTGITSTLELRRRVLWKLEARYDLARGAVFHRRDQPAGRQLLFVAGAVLTIPRPAL